MSNSKLKSKLKSKTQISNDDLISRADAIKAVNTALFPKINTAKDAEKAIEAIPSAQPKIIDAYTRGWTDGADAVKAMPQPKRGEWVEQEDCWQCSECGEEFVLEVDVKPIDAEMNFCPNCGADMRGESNDDTRCNRRTSESVKGR